jgi:aminoglycoside phosphotransferase (APT) family kinase protein
MKEIFQDIPSTDKWKVVREINDGWSNDLKFYVKDHTDTQFLLRISDGASLERERNYYDALQKLNDKDIRTSKLMDAGWCNQGKNTYRLFSWIEGVELIKIIDHISLEEQYHYGFESARILKEIHQVNSPSGRLAWGDYYNQKIDKKIAAYRNCGIKIHHSDQIIAYVQKHRNLLDWRPQSFHHGDFHIGNMLITAEKELAVIDFNRLDFGDPWEEFNRISWSATKSTSLASGQINGYFNNDVPADFFKLMALYIGVNQLGAIPWAIPYGKKEIKVTLDQAEEILVWYDNFDQTIPKWYQSGI